MNTDTHAEYIAALTDLHRGLDRQGPGDRDFVHTILRMLPSLPPKPRIADLGCGSGASALQLAQHYQSMVKAVDASPVFIDELNVRVQQAGLEDLIIPICGDMATLPWEKGSIDLLWSEGAAYNLGFQKALTLWRPLVAEGGIAVISEMSWFTDNAPGEAIAFWQNAYAEMGTESENATRAQEAGFSVLSTHRLPSQAWWKNYYDPLRERMQHFQLHPIDLSPTMQLVIDETEEEMRLFQAFSDFYGYTFYVLKAVSATMPE
jgi:ubiquinone/menaquinone biosynthesis C-methylase UbiE